MSIFDRLLQLNPTQIPLEDFFTEIFTYILESNYSFFVEFTKNFGITESNNPVISIQTQQSYDALESHFSDSRPDICIEITDEKQKHLIFIECKIGSTEGQNQLKKYAEHLDKIRFFEKKTLIFITRNHEKKNESEIFANCITKDKLQFIQIRWYEIYTLLASYYEQINCENILIKETLLFMEEYGLALDNCFTPVDILALTNFTKVQKMMDETMYGIVSDKFESVIGKASQKAACMTQLRNYNRYVYFHSFMKNFGFNVLLGYWINERNITSYPSYGISIEVSPTCEQREEIIEFMKKTVQNSEGWKGYELNVSKSWTAINKVCSLDKILGSENHIIKIQNYYLTLLEEVNSLKETYPNLTWK